MCPLRLFLHFFSQLQITTSSPGHNVRWRQLHARNIQCFTSHQQALLAWRNCRGLADGLGVAACDVLDEPKVCQSLSFLHCPSQVSMNGISGHLCPETGILTSSHFLLIRKLLIKLHPQLQRASRTSRMDQEASANRLQRFPPTPCTTICRRLGALCPTSSWAIQRG